jgi:hypothetical protein
VDGVIPYGVVDDELLAKLMGNNLVVRDGEVFKLNFSVMTREEYDAFFARFYGLGERVCGLLRETVANVRKEFKAFLPKRLAAQEGMWVKGYVYNVIGMAAEELIRRGVLERPRDNRPLVNGVLCVMAEELKI